MYESTYNLKSVSTRGLLSGFLLELWNVYICFVQVNFQIKRRLFSTINSDDLTDWIVMTSECFSNQASSSFKCFCCQVVLVVDSIGISSIFFDVLHCISIDQSLLDSPFENSLRFHDSFIKKKKKT